MVPESLSRSGSGDASTCWSSFSLKALPNVAHDPCQALCLERDRLASLQLAPWPERSSKKRPKAARDECEHGCTRLGLSLTELEQQ